MLNDSATDESIETSFIEVSYVSQQSLAQLGVDARNEVWLLYVSLCFSDVKLVSGLPSLSFNK